MLHAHFEPCGLAGIFLNKGKNPTVFIDTYSHHAFYFALSCALFCQLMDTKYIPILRGGNLPMRLRKNQYLSKIIFSRSVVNISPSIFLKMEFEKYGFNSRYIPNIIRIQNEYRFEVEFSLREKGFVEFHEKT